MGDRREALGRARGGGGGASQHAIRRSPLAHLHKNAAYGTRLSRTSKQSGGTNDHHTPTAPNRIARRTNVLVRRASDGEMLIFLIVLEIVTLACDARVVRLVSRADPPGDGGGGGGGNGFDPAAGKSQQSQQQQQQQRPPEETRGLLADA